MAVTMSAHRHYHSANANSLRFIQGLVRSVLSVFGKDEGGSTVESALVLILISATVLVGVQAVGAESARLWLPIQAAAASLIAP